MTRQPAPPRVLAPIFVLVCHAIVAEGPFEVETTSDLFREFSSARVRNALTASASTMETAGKVRRSGIFLHPNQSEKEAELIFDDVAIPVTKENAKPFLLFYVGFRDGIPWGTPEENSNGVRFSARAGDTTLYSESLRGAGWRFRVVPLERWSGKRTTITLTTHANGTNNAHDWSVFAEPIVALVRATNDASKLAPSSPGLALAEVEVKSPSTVSLSIAGAKTTTRLEKGRRWIACEFASASEPSFRVDEGAAELRAMTYSSWAATLELERFELRQPWAVDGAPVDLALQYRNTGKGRFGGSPAPTIEIFTRDGRAIGTTTAPLTSLGSGETRDVLVPWKTVGPSPELVFRSGDRELAVDVFTERTNDTLHALPEKGARCRVSESQEVRIARLQNPWAELRFEADTAGRVRTRIHSRIGKSSQPAATLYPVAELIVDTKAGPRQRSTFRLRRFVEENERRLRLEGTFEPRGSQAWKVRLSLEIAPDHPRVYVNLETEAPDDAKLRLLRTLRCFVGGRNGESNRDFAIFPGLEYLEGPEHSSSTRDLAWPLSDRRVPAPYKIASPLMAMQRGEQLIGAMWDPRQSWTKGHQGLAAGFDAPPPTSARRRNLIELSVPSIGDSRAEHSQEADPPIDLRKEQKIRVLASLLVDSQQRYAKDHPARVGRPGAFVIESLSEYFAEFDVPEASPPPRTWEEQKALSRHAYFDVLWNEDPAGVGHCHNWPKGLFVSHSVPLLLDARDGADAKTRAEIQRRVAKLVDRSILERGRGSLWNGAGCHILLGELPFLEGHVGPSLAAFRDHAKRVLAQRRDGVWLWHPSSEKHRSLGTPGTHTSGQAARPCFLVLRAARLSGDAELARAGLDALKVLERYQVPRGAQTWECPVMQPDILTSAYAIRAYCEAYRLTGDAAHLQKARYWAMTGLPFVYTWSFDDYPTMRYNTIAVMGSTFHTHSWIGLPVVWCGLVYAYGLQDLAQWDSSFDWKRIAQGITRSAMWQQYTEGPSRGCYPDSWHMVENEPRPADINPENILINEYRLRGLSPEIVHARLTLGSRVVHLNSGATKLLAQADEAGRSITLEVEGPKGFAFYTVVASGRAPKGVRIGGEALPGVTNSDELRAAESAWRFDADLGAIIVKTTASDEATTYSLSF